MRFFIGLFIAVAALSGKSVALAQDHSVGRHVMPMAAAGEDGRESVKFPPQMRQHILANMRDHMQALSDVLAALANDDYTRAARIADAHLGMNSPAAEGCKPAGIAADTPQMSRPGNMEDMMAQFMPGGMRKIGLAMHQSASDFAALAAKAAETGDGKPALVALVRVTQQCTACHSIYKVP